MKNLLIALAIAMVAVMTHAAAVSWTSGTFAQGFKGPDGNTLGSSTDYTAVFYVYSDSAGANAVTSGSDSTANKGQYNGVTGDALSASTTYYAQLIVTAKDNSYQIKSSIASFSTPDTGNASLNFINGSGFDTVSAKIDSSSGWAPAPEPTSFGLMMLGLAALALRRRHA